jgi:hypothetical protein
VNGSDGLLFFEALLGQADDLIVFEQARVRDLRAVGRDLVVLDALTVIGMSRPGSFHARRGTSAPRREGCAGPGRVDDVCGDQVRQFAALDVEAKGRVLRFQDLGRPRCRCRPPR